MKLVAICAAALLTVVSTNAEARHRHHHYAHHHYHHRHYAGVGHFVCGLTQRLYFGIKDTSLNLALEWAHKFPHTSAQAGAVVVQRRRGHALGGGPGGHVSRIVQLTGQCRAMVTDEKGTYERDICKNLVAYVTPR